MNDWLNPRFAVALLIIALFAWAFGELFRKWNVRPMASGFVSDHAHQPCGNIEFFGERSPNPFARRVISDFRYGAIRELAISCDWSRAVSHLILFIFLMGRPTQIILAGVFLVAIIVSDFVKGRGRRSVECNADNPVNLAAKVFAVSSQANGGVAAARPRLQNVAYNAPLRWPYPSHSPHGRHFVAGSFAHGQPNFLLAFHGGYIAQKD